MLNRQTHLPSNESPYLKPTKFNQNQANQHGLPDNRILLGVPSETLTGITSYLDPPSLFSLARVHGRLHSHVKNDSTWHRAFVCQFLNIGPESEIHDDAKSLMLRRSENTWRNEFIMRYRLRRRWERSRNATVAHIPVHSEISSMHMMPGGALLASSTRYGIVSRSLPLTGKILPGYLDASGLHLGLGVGNPNAEFSPDVSACALISDGGTAKVLWGFRHGEVGVMTAPRAIDAARRPATDMVRCDVNEEHVGAVLDAIWDDTSGAIIVTAGADGTIKIWDSKTVRCLSTFGRREGSLVPDACLKVAISVTQGIISTVTRSGEVVLWMGLELQSLDAFSTASLKEVRIPCPVVPISTTTESTIEASHIVSSLYIDPYSVVPTILLAYEKDPHFYRLRIANSGIVETTTFGNASFGPISTLDPTFSPESTFILTGDHIGCVSVYDWSTPSRPTGSIHCVRKFEAHEDGASVTALTWNGITLVTGSARGTTHIWDGLTFEHLRSFPSPTPRMRHRGPGTNILVSVGDRVLAWKAGPVPRTSAGGVRGRYAAGAVGKKKKDRNGTAKYLRKF
ncbi:WD40-repeat-containing domain protein [Lyophyllum atratum]|nr:WD40-repeat-containing domain protein [Lyophyllum atratum]